MSENQAVQWQRILLLAGTGSVRNPFLHRHNIQTILKDKSVQVGIVHEQISKLARCDSKATRELLIVGVRTPGRHKIKTAIMLSRYARFSVGLWRNRNERFFLRAVCLFILDGSGFQKPHCCRRFSSIGMTTILSRLSCSSYLDGYLTPALTPSKTGYSLQRRL